MRRIPVLLLFYPAIEGFFVALYFATDSMFFAVLSPVIGSLSFVVGLSHELSFLIFSSISVILSIWVAKLEKRNPVFLAGTLIFISILVLFAMRLGNQYAMRTFAQLKKSEQRKLAADRQALDGFIETTYAEADDPDSTGKIGSIRLTASDARIRNYAGQYRLYLVSTDNSGVQNEIYEGFITIEADAPYMRIDETVDFRKSFWGVEMKNADGGVELIVYFDNGGPSKIVQLRVDLRRSYGNENNFSKEFAVSVPPD